jgi:GTPase Era involved in 16S rRNA processing
VPVGKPVVLALNKLDAVADKARLLPLAPASGEAGRRAIVPISARTGRQVDELLGECAKHLPEGQALFATPTRSPTAASASSPPSGPREDVPAARRRAAVPEHGRHREV